MPESEVGVFVVCRHRWLCSSRHFCDAVPPASDSLRHVGSLLIMLTAAPDTVLSSSLGPMHDWGLLFEVLMRLNPQKNIEV
jgi:hypothetical protein